MTTSCGASPAAEVQTLLRFLSQDARVPLSTALSKINDLRKANLNTPETIAKSNALTELSPIFSGDEKLAKQILAAAKRVSKNPQSSKKRPASGADDTAASKRARGQQNSISRGNEQQSPSELEAFLALPVSTLSIEELESITLLTNRAPLLLAFAVTLLKYTMPEQPLSSRLSLAQAVVSANSRSKAQSIGLVGGKSAEQEGWGEGQPRVRVMGRSVPVMRRSGYDPSAEGRGGADGEDEETKEEDEKEGSQATVQADPQPQRELPLWGLDLEALRDSNTGPSVAQAKSNRTRNPPYTSTSPNLPIHTPQSARSYLLRSFTQIKDPSKTDYKKPTPSQVAADRSTSLAHLLRALDILISSWATPSSPHTGTPLHANPDHVEALDRRAWSWYVQVRPEVRAGEKGWGEKGMVGLGGILGLRRGEG